MSDGDHSKFPDNQKDEVRYLQAKDIKNHFIENNNPVFISKEYFDKNKRSHIKEENVILSIMGSVGDIAITPKGFKPSLANRAVAIIKEITDVNPYYLFTYLSTKFGQLQINRQKNGGVQVRINLDVLSKVKIPYIHKGFQLKIEGIVKLAHKTKGEFQVKYRESEELLLKEIGLRNFEPSKEPVNIKNFAESFGVSGRLDAEYYQSKYDDYLRLIFDYSDGYEELSTACNLHNKNFKPEENTEYKYIELSNVGKSGEINGCTNEIGKNLPSRARRKVSEGDVVVSSIEGSLDSCALVTNEYNGSLCSTGFYVINSNKINSETLLILFKSELMQNILKQNCSGTILTAINKDEFLKIPIPLIDLTKQIQIAELVEQSFKLKKESEHLLEVAKTAVEIAIEQNEAVALDFIAKNAVS